MLEDGRPLHQFKDPVFLVDRDKDVVAGNPAALRIVHGMIEGAQDRLLGFIDAAFAGSSSPDSLRILDPELGTTTDLAAVPLDGGAHLLLLGRDVSLDDNLRATLVESRQRYKDLVEISSDFAWETGAAGTFTFVSPGGGVGL